MCDLHLNAELKRDPTRTTTLRNQFQAEAYKRFRRLKGRIRKVIVEDDGFGLKQRVNVNQGRFDFPTNDRKVSAFMEWLREAQRQEILEVSEGVPLERAARRAWTSTYIETAYQRGIAQAAGELRKEGATVADEWVSAAFNRPVHADRLGLAYIRAYSELRGITQAMDQQISRVLAQGIGEGLNPMQIASNINGRVDKVGLTRARVLARTEVINAHAEASLNTYEEAGVEGVDARAEFATAGDARVCPECESLEGVTRPISEARGIIPVHPNCLTGDALVTSGSPVSGVSKRVFNGDMIVFETASGRRLTCTPNHPILTDAGWQPAEALNLGSHVICDGGREWEALIDDDNQNAIPSIHDVAESFLGSSEVATMPVPTTAEHFHGDGAGSEVAIIGADRRLLFEGDTASGELGKNEPLKRRGVGLARLFPLGSVAKLFKAALGAAHRIMGGGNLIPALGLAHLGPLERFRLAPPPHRDASLFQKSLNPSTAKPGTIGDGQAGLPGSVPSDNTVCPHGHKLPLGSVFAAKQSHDDLVRDAVLARKLASGSACKVFTDKVVSVYRFNFSGHVYNLETKEHWYSANGIITHNCRCAWIPKVVNGTGIELR